ncbi:hypothetical protein D3C86_1657230 [compost metagenome]
MGHGAKRGHVVQPREVDVAGTGKLRAEDAARGQQHLLLPGARETPAGAVVCDHAVGVGRRLQQRELGLQAPAALSQVRCRLGAAEIDLVDDGQQGHLEQDRMEPRAADRDVDLTATLLGRRDRDVLLAQVEQSQEIDEIALDEAHAAQVVEFFLGEAELAEVGHFGANLVDIRGQVDARIAALEPVLDLSLREAVQHHLHHCELVQVGV